MVIYIVDTNFLLQFKPPSDVSWNDITEAEAIDLLVLRPVQREIDRHKGDGRSRRAQRAKWVTSIFANALDNDQLTTVLRDNGPRVSLTLSGPIALSGDVPEELDVGHCDDRVIAEAIVLRDQGKSVTLLTGDSNMMVTARHLGVPYVRAPQTWLLPPEATAVEKRIRTLENEVAALQDSEPVISLSALDEDENEIEYVTVAVTAIEGSESQIKARVEAISARHPVRREFGEPTDPPPPVVESFHKLHPKWVEPTPDQIAEYEVQYRDWVQAWEDHLRAIVLHETFAARFADVEVSIRNDGNRPANNVVVELRGMGGLRLVVEAPTEDLDTPGAPPSPPRGRWEGPLATLLPLRTPFSPLAFGGGLKPSSERSEFDLDLPDRYAFYPVDEAPGIVRFECDEFRHKTHDIILPFKAYVGRKCKSDRAAIEYSISASNLSSPVEGVIPVTIIREARDVGPVIDKAVEAVLLAGADEAEAS